MNTDTDIRLMINFLDPDFFFEIEQKRLEAVESVADQGGRKGHQSRQRALNMNNDIKDDDNLLDKILEDTFFCFKKRYDFNNLNNFKKMYRNMLKEFFTEDIKLHTMMNLLYDFLTIKNTNRDEEQNVAQTILYSEQELNDNCRSQLYQVNIIKFFKFLLKKELDMSFNDETQFFNNIDHETLVKKIHFLITKIPNLFKILNYYKSILTNNYLSRNHNVSRISSSQPVNTDKYIFMLLHYAMNDIDDILSNDILSKNYNTTIITTNQYEEYLQYKFTEFLTKELLSKKVIQLEKRPFRSLRRKRKSNAENRTKKYENRTKNM